MGSWGRWPADPSQPFSIQCGLWASEADSFKPRLVPVTPWEVFGFTLQFKTPVYSMWSVLTITCCILIDLCEHLPSPSCGKLLKGRTDLHSFTHFLSELVSHQQLFFFNKYVLSTHYMLGVLKWATPGPCFQGALRFCNRSREKWKECKEANNPREGEDQDRLSLNHTVKGKCQFFPF